MIITFSKTSKLVIKIALMFIVLILVFECFVSFSLLNVNVAWLVAIPLLIIYYNLLYLMDLFGILIFSYKVNETLIQRKRQMPISNMWRNVLPFAWSFYIVKVLGENRCVRIVSLQSGHEKIKSLLIYYSIIDNRTVAFDRSIIVFRIAIVVLLSGLVKVLINVFEKV